MTAALSLVATGVLVALTLWSLGGALLRAGGLLFAVGGLLFTATSGSPTMVVASILGGLAWLTGHWLYAVRHHCFRSPLARRIVLRALPAKFDPTRGWGVPNVSQGSRR
jgi:hypothetical protein